MRSEYDQLNLTWWQQGLDLLLPANEVVGDAAMLDAEWSPVDPAAMCWRCGQPMEPAGITATGCSVCRGRPLATDAVVSLGVWEQPLTTWVASMKFRGNWAWATWFGRQLAERIEPERGAIVTAVPLHWARRLSRGYDQSEMMAKALADRAGIPYVPTLRRVRRTQRQADLKNFKARNDNVRKAFAALPLDLTGCTVYLVDDVKTTGNTSRRCARVLKSMGAKRVMLCVAAVAKHHDYQARPV